ATVPRGVLQGTAPRPQAAREDRHRDHPRRSLFRLCRPARQARLRPDRGGEVMGALAGFARPSALTQPPASVSAAAPEAVGGSVDPRCPVFRRGTVFEDGSVEPLHPRDRSGVLAAAGTVNGVRTIAFCTGGTVMGGAMGGEGCAHIVNAYDTAIEEQSPIVGIWHSGGARLAEGVKALHAVGLVFEAMIRASGYVPQISVVVGFAAGGAAYGPALTDVVIMAPE